MYTIVKCSVLVLVFLNLNCSSPLSSKLDFGSARLLGFINNNKTKREFSELGVVCSDTGCNTTKEDNKANGAIKTNVFVQVQTNVDLKQNKTDFNAETPDIPIIVGKVDNKLSNNNPESLLTNNNNFRLMNTGNTGNWYPVVNPIQSIENINSAPVIPNYIYDVHSLKPSLKAINVANTPQFIPTIIDQNWKIKGFEMKIPYSESSYNKHYPDERPPQYQPTFYSRNYNFNPNEFRKATWNPSLPSSFPSRYHPNGNSNCVCHDNRDRTGLQWNPNRRIHQQNQPLPHIDDKLAPLI